MKPRQRRDVAASVRDRLFALARERGEDFQLVLTRFAAERLLYRLSRSKYSDQFLLKGAMLMYRPTRDVDLLGRGENEVARLEGIFRDVCQVSVQDDGLEFLGETIQGSPIREGDDDEGARLALTARLAQAKIPLQVDIAFGDAVRPEPEEAEFPTILALPAPRLRVYPREAVIAEKFQIMVTLGIANSRMKDFFDIWTLARTNAFEGPMLAEAIAATFARRRTPLPTAPPMALTPEFSEDRSKQAQWDAFVRRGRLEVGRTRLGDVIALLRDFVLPPTFATAAGKPFDMRWPVGGPWQPATARRRRSP